MDRSGHASSREPWSSVLQPATHRDLLSHQNIHKQSQNLQLPRDGPQRISAVGALAVVMIVSSNELPARKRPWLPARLVA